MIPLKYPPNSKENPLDAYIQQTLEHSKNIPRQKEFPSRHRTVIDVSALFWTKSPNMSATTFLQRIVSRARQIGFRVTWMDDAVSIQVNQRLPIQYNSTLGPYKGEINSIQREQRIYQILASNRFLRMPSSD
jgi:hypothetical protein